MNCARPSPHRSTSREYYFSTRDLVLIAVASAAGGVLSTYVGYLGNLMNRAFAVPFGAGQWMAGLHVFWFVLARAIVGRTGAGALTGVLKGLVEMFSGSTHGLPILLVSAVEGALVDLVLLPFPRPSLGALCLAGAVSSASNVVVFQTMYFSGVSFGYVGLMILFAAASGAAFGGFFTRGVLDVVAGANLLRVAGGEKARSRNGERNPARMVIAIAMALLLASGAVYYYACVFRPFWNGPVCAVEGNVEKPYEFRPPDFEDVWATVRAELVGQVTYRPPADYEGVPLAAIVERAHPLPSAAKVRIMASDGYEAEYLLDDLLEQEDVILSVDGDTLSVVAPGYEGAYWVRMVTRISIE
ncbi:MAG: ECF transporter S component [Clostridia bacterium]|nr:ECF transporter S component [Clostridia bacterium]